MVVVSSNPELDCRCPRASDQMGISYALLRAVKCAKWNFYVV